MPSRPTARAAAETKKFDAEARYHDALAELVEIELETAEEDRAEELADDWHARVYRFAVEVEHESVLACMHALGTWSRLDTNGSFEVVFTSPGGNSLPGWSLFDFMRSLSRQGHNIITTDLGYACSMAGILLQAGDVRQIGAESWFHVHEVAWEMDTSKLSAHRDEVDVTTRMQDRVYQIFADRSGGKMTAEQVHDFINRRESWFNAEDAVKYGFADVIV